MEIRKETRQIEILSMDVTRHCNARCRFCFNDWANIQPASLGADLFPRIIPLMKLVKDDRFLLSCLFEPTLNDDFFTMLKQIPAEFKDKLLFTTNLVRPLTDEQIRIMAEAPLAHINISLESYDPEVYKMLAGVKQSAFYDNLNRLAAACQKTGTHICIITMLLKSNYREMKEIVRRVHEEVHPWTHEIRTPYFFVAEDRSQWDKVEAELLSREEIDSTMKEVMELGYDNLVLDLRHDRNTYMKEKEVYLQTGFRDDGSYDPIKYSYIVRIGAAGTVQFSDTMEKHDIRDIDEDLYTFCHKGLMKLEETEASRYFDKALNLFQVKEDKDDEIQAYLDEAVIFDDRFLYLRGWAFLKNIPAEEEPECRIIVRKGHSYSASRITVQDRPDLAEHFKAEAYRRKGFETRIDMLRNGFEKNDSIWIAFKSGKKYIMHKLIEDHIEN
ncbi:MAG: radical SAM protein [Solobacterium sp.]|nr:radical SAM protein [Solobacterium sp.]